jgi:hypothetical protein
MPKPITITIQVEEVAFGRIFNLLDKMPGVVALNLHGSGSKPNGAAPKKRGATSASIILKILTTANCGRELLRSAMVKEGKSPASLQSTIDYLRKNKHIQDMPKGLFRITAAGRKYYSDATKGE